MASVVDSVALSRFSALPIVSSSSSASAVCCVSDARRSSERLPEFAGLRMKQTVFARSLRSENRPAKIVRGGRIVCEVTNADVKVPPVTEKTWQSLVLDSEVPVVVEFWASWCGPCRKIHPIVNELNEELDGKIKFFNVNTEDSPSIATRYGVRSIPTVMIFKGGEKKDVVIGAVPKTTLTSSIEKHL